MIVVVGGVLAYVFVVDADPDRRAGSELLEPGPVDVASRVPSAYRVVYRVTSHAGDDLVVTTERLIVRRPFEARLESWSGPPPGDELNGTTVNAFARLASADVVFAVPPAAAPPDRRPDAFLADALDRGYAAVAERRRVLGRMCRIYRIAGDPGSSSLPRVSEDAGDGAVVCIDEAGLVLEEVTFADGDILGRRIAVEVDEEPDIDEGAFEAGDPTMDVRQGGGSVREVTADSRPPQERYWELDEPPEGYTHMGRYAVIPPQSGFDDPIQRGGIVASMTDVWIDGHDVLIVEQGGTLEGRPAFSEDPNARTVDAGALGTAELRYSLRGSEVRVIVGAGRFVRIGGTLPPPALLEVARSLQARPPGTLSFVDEAG